MAAAFGLTPEQALRSITLSPAEILGVAHVYGSIEVGKSATLIVTDGNPLEITTNVHKAFLDGEELEMIDRHKRFYDKYRNRPRPSILGPSQLDPAPGQ